MTGLDPGLIALLAPLVVLEIGLAIWALSDLTRPGRRVRGESRLMWGLIILLVSLIGPILYLVVGRQEGDAEPEPRSWPTAAPAVAEPDGPG